MCDAAKAAPQRTEDDDIHGLLEFRREKGHAGRIRYLGETLTMTMRYANLTTFDLDNCVAVLEYSVSPKAARAYPPEADI